MKTNHRQTLARAESGFTLAELMVTVLILGILVTMAAGLFNTSIQNANQKACVANVDTINLAIARAALILGKPISAINDPAVGGVPGDTAHDDAANVDSYITGGIASLKCSVKSHPATYQVVRGVINPAHNH